MINDVNSLNVGSKRKRRTVKKIAWTTPERQATQVLSCLSHAYTTWCFAKQKKCVTFLDDGKDTINPERSWTTTVHQLRKKIVRFMKQAWNLAYLPNFDR